MIDNAIARASEAELRNTVMRIRNEPGMRERVAVFLNGPTLSPLPGKRTNDPHRIEEVEDLLAGDKNGGIETHCEECGADLDEDDYCCKSEYALRAK